VITRSTVSLAGDLNLPHRPIDWIAGSAPNDYFHSLFTKFCSDFGFEQYVNMF